MSLANEHSESEVKKLDLRMTIKKPTQYDKGYVINAGGDMVTVAKQDVDKYAGRKDWKKPTAAEIKKHLGKAAEPTQEDTNDDDGDMITSVDIRKMNTKTLEAFMKNYEGELEGIEFKDEATLADKKDGIITHLGLEE